VGGDAVLEGEMLGEPVLMGDSEAFGVGPGIGSGQGGGQCDEDDFAEVVIQSPIEPEVGHFFNVLVNTGGDAREHGRPP
jgi:hypothetical protein